MISVGDIPSRLARYGRNQADLARHLGLDPSSLTKLIKGGRQLKAAEMVAIEYYFEDLEAGAAILSELRPAPTKSRARAAPAKVPIYGYAAAGGDDRIAFNEGQVIDWMDAPPDWSGAGVLIGIRVVGSSMEPRLFQGELLIAQRKLAPVRGRDCVIELIDGSALVKSFEGQRADVVLCRQWNPEKELLIPAVEVKALHAVIWRR